MQTNDKYVIEFLVFMSNACEQMSSDSFKFYQ